GRDELGVRLFEHTLSHEVVHDAGAQPVDVDNARLAGDPRVLALTVVPAAHADDRRDRGEPVERAPRARVAAVADEVDAAERLEYRLRQIRSVRCPAVVVRDDADATHVRLPALLLQPLK